MRKRETKGAPLSSDASKEGVNGPPITGRRVLLNTGAMASSSLWRILISFVLQLLVARILGLEAHGRYTVALAYLNVSQILTEMGLQNLLVRNLARRPQDKRRFFAMSLVLQLCASLIVWVLLWGGVNLFPYSAAMQRILWLVGATLPFYAITISCQTIFQSSERMELVMLVEVIINTLIGILSFLILYQQGDVAQLISLLIVTQAFSAILCLYLLFKERMLETTDPRLANANHKIDAPQSKSQRKLFNFRDYNKLIQESIPFYGLSLADVLLQRLDILLLSIFAGETITGIYSIAYNVVRVLQKLTQSYWKALYPTLSRLAHQAFLGKKTTSYKTLQQTALKYGLVILLGAAAVASPAGTLLLELIYGADIELSVASNVFGILIWSAPLYLFELYAITILMAENRPKASLFIMTLHLVAVALLLPGLTAGYGAQGAGWAVFGATAFGTIISIVITRRLTALFAYSVSKWLLFPPILTAICLIFIPFINIFTVFCGIVLYLALVWLCGIVTLADLSKLRST